VHEEVSKSSVVEELNAHGHQQLKTTGFMSCQRIVLIGNSDLYGSSVDCKMGRDSEVVSKPFDFSTNGAINRESQPAV